MTTLQRTLGLSKPPIAVGFFDKAPAGCALSRTAANGRTFYTVPSDLFNRVVEAIGAIAAANETMGDHYRPPNATVRGL